jgi:zinc protease
VEASLPDVLRLAAEVLREPSYPEKEFEQARQQRLAGIEAARSDPGALAGIAFQKRLAPFRRGDVRFISSPDEQIEDIKNVSLDDIRKFHDQFYGASDGELVIVGQFDPAEARKLADELFGNWKTPSGYKRVVTEYQKTEPGDLKIETPDKQNATLLAGMQIRMSDEDGDYAAMELANFILGGSFGSRLVHRIRDQEGLSYGVRSGFDAPTEEDSADFTAQVIAAPQNVPKAEASLKDELARVLKDGFTKDEIDAGKKAMLEQEVVGRTQDQGLARLLAARERFGRTMKFDEAFESKIGALTAEQVNAAVRRHLDPAGFLIVKAGDFKKAGVLQ